MTGLNFFCLRRICFLGLIYCDRRRLLFFGVHIRLLTRCKILFHSWTVKLFFSKESFSLKSLMNIKRFDWFIERIQTHLAFGWLSERSAEKTSCPKNFLETALTSYCNTIGQSNNAFSILGFLRREKEESMFCSFHPLADQTNNKHLPKPFFKDIRSLPPVQVTFNQEQLCTKHHLRC